MSVPSQNRYVLDTRFFVLAREYYPEIFPSFWEEMDASVRKSVLVSVKEVQDEIAGYGGEQAHLVKWMSRHKDIFGSPGEAEQEKIIEIMRRFWNALAQQEQGKYLQSADPWVVARAWTIKGVVVTGEKPVRTNTTPERDMHQVPDICHVLNVRCITPRQFMKEQKWRF